MNFGAFPFLLGVSLCLSYKIRMQLSWWGDYEPCFGVPLTVTSVPPPARCLSVVLPWIYMRDLCTGLEAHHLPRQEALDGTMYPKMCSQDDKK